MFAALTRLFRRAALEPRWIEVAALRQLLSGDTAPPLVVDVRDIDEFDGPLGHIDGAHNIPLHLLDAHQATLVAEERPIVLVCLTDKRSSAAAAQLAQAGFRDLAVLRGGMKAWREAE